MLLICFENVNWSNIASRINTYKHICCWNYAKRKITSRICFSPLQNLTSSNSLLFQHIAPSNSTRIYNGIQPAFVESEVQESWLLIIILWTMTMVWNYKLVAQDVSTKEVPNDDVKSASFTETISVKFVVWSCGIPLSAIAFFFELVNVSLRFANTFARQMKQCLLVVLWKRIHTVTTLPNEFQWIE